MVSFGQIVFKWITVEVFFFYLADGRSAAVVWCAEFDVSGFAAVILFLFVIEQKEFF